MYDPRSVALKEYLPEMKDTVGNGWFFIGPVGICAMSLSLCAGCFALSDLSKQSGQQRSSITSIALLGGLRS
jgi:hypothetical protein